MRYEYVKPDRRFFGPVHWGHVVRLYCKQERLEELHTFLDDVVGENRWRVSTPWDYVAEVLRKSDDSATGYMEVYRAQRRTDRIPTRVKFLDQNHAMRVKLMWDECNQPPGFDTPPSVLISLVRNVMPQVMANNIIGVQPMTGPTSSIYSLRTRYGS